ncbi:MAG: hypothetical protein U9N73_03750 [Candidatus Auribacterota bacterium]|nr:hypothetical protein [Candidatus Auribacterota bacterium]
MKPAKKQEVIKESLARYYDRRGILNEIEEGPVVFSLEDDLREQILRGKRTRRLKNISIKLEQAQIQALQKIAVQKSIPYQTLIRSFLAEAIKRELHI